MLVWVRLFELSFEGGIKAGSGLVTIPLLIAGLSFRIGNDDDIVMVMMDVVDLDVGDGGIWRRCLGLWPGRGHDHGQLGDRLQWFFL